MHSGMRCRQGG